jgi:hypothetical protein
VQTVKEEVEKEPEAFDEIVWVLFGRASEAAYDEALKEGENNA